MNKTELIISNQSRTKISEVYLYEIFGRFLKFESKIISRMLGKRKGVINLIFIGNKRMKDLNFAYRNKNKTTDVLSFAFMKDADIEFRDFGDLAVLGDIYISIPMAKKQASTHCHDIKKEINILFTHGLLHVIGFDHNTDKEEKLMEKEALKILK